MGFKKHLLQGDIFRNLEKGYLLKYITYSVQFGHLVW